MRGSCLCGTVAFEAEPPAEGLRIGLCSCPSCRKAHAAPCNVYASVPRAGFRWLRGEDAMAGRGEGLRIAEAARDMAAADGGRGVTAEHDHAHACACPAPAS